MERKEHSTLVVDVVAVSRMPCATSNGLFASPRAATSNETHPDGLLWLHIPMMRMRGNTTERNTLSAICCNVLRSKYMLARCAMCCVFCLPATQRFGALTLSSLSSSRLPCRKLCANALTTFTPLQPDNTTHVPPDRAHQYHMDPMMYPTNKRVEMASRTMLVRDSIVCASFYVDSTTTTTMLWKSYPLQTHTHTTLVWISNQCAWRNELAILLAG